MNESRMLCRLTNHEPMHPETFNMVAQLYCFKYLALVFNSISFDPDAYNLSFPINEANLRAQLNSEYMFEKWKQCSDAARSCCANVLSKSFSDESHCDAVWDGWSCHSATKAGQISEVKCADYILEDNCHFVLGNTKFTCTKNATWFRLEGQNEWSNYSYCLEPTASLNYQTINLNVFTNLVSLICLVCGLVVFFSYR